MDALLSNDAAHASRGEAKEDGCATHTSADAAPEVTDKSRCLDLDEQVAVSSSSHRLQTTRTPLGQLSIAEMGQRSSLRSCLKVAVSQGPDDLLVRTPLASSFTYRRSIVDPANTPTRPKSVLISEDLPKRHDSLQRASSCRSLSQTRSASDSRFLSRHRRITSEALPTTSPSFHEASPTLSGSTCDSEEDRAALDTPLDERLLSYGEEGNSSDMASEYCADSEHIPNPSSDSFSDPSFSFARRDVARQASQPVTSSQRPALRRLPSLDRRSTSIHSVLSNSLDKSSVSSMTGISSAVSTGLEMGLGLGGMACRNVYSLTTADRKDLSPLQSDLNSVPSREDQSDLSRRRTTGSLYAASTNVGRKRIHRIGAQDPYGVRTPDQPHSACSNTAPSSPIVDYERTLASMSTPYGTPSHEHRASLSPILGMDAELSSNESLVGMHHGDYSRTPVDVRNRSMVTDAQLVTAECNVPGGLMGIGQVGHFGPGVRAKVTNVLNVLVPTLPIVFDNEEVVHMIEYGSSKSRSALLFQPVISTIARQSMKHNTTSSSDRSCRVSFCISHDDAHPSEFHSTMQLLDSHSDSYMDASWQTKHIPCLQNVIFPSFTAGPFGARIAPPNTMHLGLSLMDMHWSHTPIVPSVSRVAAAEAELTAFLRARANEFKKNGVLIMAYIARREQSHTEGIQGKDIWTTLRDVLVPCIQRLVSCGMLKSDLARFLLELPLIPRTSSETRASLNSVKQFWNLDWSCGLEETDGGAEQQQLSSEPDLVRLPHPAWKAYESGCLSRVAFTEHVIQLFKTLYEAHFRTTLREKGRFSKGAVEFVLDSLWDALFSRIVDQPSAIIQNVEIEVCLYALRRR